ncbi:hypothetical protein HYPSUDRAFT_49374 [Hypholoma sublateritium FD-334 SS-4]|uniref:MARVEL domain-containing protein n=1 Tax=Hypholoma sublateritium (strain FD-334 SS-4) TaxID=945553 RepID=A0A0D2N4U0_HYPSF|nr:hypothetical protein HYPSUDRAFT_49374 [Hypholoma sublateritium FD-334 SS-4]
MAPPKRKAEQEADNRIFVPSTRSWIYLATFILIFCLTCAELGLVSQQIHKYGRWTFNYATLQYKNAIGLLLCACLISLLLCLGHYWIAVGGTAFTSLILSVFFGTVAGIFRVTTPFRGHDCGRPQDSYPVIWRPWFQECSRVVAMEGIAWSLWALYLCMMIGTLLYMFQITPRPTPGGYYGSPTRVVPSYV